MKDLKKTFSTSLKMGFVFCLFFSFTAHIASQEIIDKKVEVTLRNDQKFIGVIQEQTTTSIVLFVEDIGEMTIKKINIESIRPLKPASQDVDSRGYPVDYYNSTRYLINPSGYGLEKGQAYYENIYVFFNSYSYGVTDRITIALGGEIASLLFGGDFPVLYGSARFNIPFRNNQGAFSAGLIYFTIPEDDLDGIGLAQSSLTLGSRNNNINFGFGIGFSPGEGDAVYSYQAGATVRLSRRLSFVTDNFVINDGEFDNDNVYILSAALRIHFNSSGAAVNAGLWRPLEDLNDLLAIPVVSATIPLK